MPSPEAIADALASNLKRLRAERGLTLEGLAKRARISRGMLIQIEQRRVNPTLATLVRLGEALDTGLGELVELGARRRARVISRDEAADLWSSGSGSSGRLLVGSDQLDHIELWEWRFEPGDAHRAEAHLTGTVEILHVLEGDLALGVGGESYTATSGESIVFSADADHCYENGGPGVMRLLMVVITPPAASTAKRASDHRPAVSHD